jgi:hypothetical protein
MNSFMAGLALSSGSIRAGSAAGCMELAAALAGV